jgi:hypothetical protein
VSTERRRIRFDEEASVRMEALSVQTPLAVAALYVAGCRSPDELCKAGECGVGPCDGNGAEYITGGSFGLW